MQNMPADIERRVTAYAKKHGINRNAAINLLCVHALEILDPAPAAPARNERVAL